MHCTIHSPLLIQIITVHDLLNHNTKLILLFHTVNKSGNLLNYNHTDIPRLYQHVLNISVTMKYIITKDVFNHY